MINRANKSSAWTSYERINEARVGKIKMRNDFSLEANSEETSVVENMIIIASLINIVTFFARATLDYKCKMR